MRSPSNPSATKVCDISEHLIREPFHYISLVNGEGGKQEEEPLTLLPVFGFSSSSSSKTCKAAVDPIFLTIFPLSLLLLSLSLPLCFPLPLRICYVARITRFT